MQLPGLDKHLVASVYPNIYAERKQHTAPLIDWSCSISAANVTDSGLGLMANWYTGSAFFQIPQSYHI